MKDKKATAVDPRPDQPKSAATSARRRFLGKVGKVAVTTSAVTLMLSAGAKAGLGSKISGDQEQTFIPGDQGQLFNEWH